MRCFYDFYDFHVSHLSLYDFKGTEINFHVVKKLWRCLHPNVVHKVIITSYFE